MVETGFSIRALPKTKHPTTRIQRLNALRMFLNGARNLGVTDAWLVGSMATGRDHSLSDVDLCVKGNFNLNDLYSLRDKVYMDTNVVIQLSLEPARNPKVKVL